MTLGTPFQPDHVRYEGVRPFQILLLRISYVLVLILVGIRSWGTIITHRGGWEPLAAAAISMWAASSLLSLIGVFHPLRMLPIVLFEVGYKVIWLIVVAWPLWSANRLSGSPAEQLTYAFLPVIAPIMLLPWPYVFRTYGWRRR